jgi:hypothetical protein
VGSWSKLAGLSRTERSLLAWSVVLLPISGLALQCCSFGRWQAMLSRLAPGRGERPDDGSSSSLPPLVGQTVRMVRSAAARSPFRATCLHQSLTLWWLLRRQDLHSEIRFGARKSGDKFEAHAWVEFRGVPLNDAAVDRHGFEPFERAWKWTDSRR